MDEATESKPPIVKVIEAVAIAAALLGAFAVIYGLSCVATGLWGLIRHGSFAGEPMWQFLHLQGPQIKLLTWDRSIFLIFGGLAICGLTNDIVEGLTGWLSKTPAQRSAARAEAKAKADLEAWNAKRIKEAQLLENARKRATRRPMSGWRRLWILLSVLAGVSAFLIAYQDGSRGYAYVTADQEIQALNGKQFWRKLFAQAMRERPELRSCIPATVEMDHSYEWRYSITCDRDDALFPAMLWALLPAALMWLVGTTVRWVYRGFRPLPAVEIAEAKERSE